MIVVVCELRLLRFKVSCSFRQGLPHEINLFISYSLRETTSFISKSCIFVAIDCLCIRKLYVVIILLIKEIIYSGISEDTGNDNMFMIILD